MNIDMTNLKVSLGGKLVLDGINLHIPQGQLWGFHGKSGSGKTTLARALAKKIFFRGNININWNQNVPPKIILIEQQHRFKNKSNVENFYYQQRFNSADTEDTVTVKEDINLESSSEEEKSKWISFFNIEHILDEPLIQLSNGENKRLQLTKAMLKKPDLLILDNPFIGLDIEGREILRTALNRLNESHVSMILFSEPEDMPSCISHLAIIENGTLTYTGLKNDYTNQAYSDKIQILDTALLSELQKNETPPFEFAVNMKNVCISYEKKMILNNINWLVEKGDKWCVSGPNGSGKSTLLSLITADNPQAYANDIYLFDRKRGSGESIWDIKKHIGYLSPELHLFFEQGITCFQAVACGIFDTIGLFRIPNADQKNTIQQWMKLLQIDHLQERYLNQLSLGEQRLVLLARALVKSPSLLILDEPCQGLDKQQTSYFKSLIDQLCSSKNITLIYVSHYKSDIPNAVTKFLQLEKGKII